MPFQITNTSSGPVLIRLRSGATLHLVPGERSPELEDPDVRNNPRLEPLLARRLVTMQEVSSTSRGGGARREAGAAGARGRSSGPRSRKSGDEGDSDEHRS
jgi:hypothetical protein